MRRDRDRVSGFPWLKRYRHTKLAVVCYLLLVGLVSWIPMLYTLNASIPPLEDLNRSVGVLSFTDSKRWGSRMSLLTAEGVKHKFLCKVSSIDNGTCGNHEHAGKRAVVWWHPLDLHLFETIKHPVQIEVEGKLVLTYERSLQKLASAKTKEPWFAVITTLLFLLLIIFIYKIDKRRHESRGPGLHNQ